ncbi:DUF6932 family protein [Geodermatophilus amargosae]|uniref:DUF6932 family protein n=1 Tax=Geodermatophilus amargosae TaxID=1296565 RepID=UPI000B89CD44|nr:hypothetical protein [Geodermatophilus amargosae]
MVLDEPPRDVGEWQQAAAALREVVPVCAAWLGGSFLSETLEPNDIDCVWVVDEGLLNTARADPETRRYLSLFANGLIRQDDMRVDCSILPWRPRPGIEMEDARDQEYAMWRGYWDDFWQRVRNGPKGAPRTTADALPRRGYVEVVLDGFPE